MQLIHSQALHVASGAFPNPCTKISRRLRIQALKSGHETFENAILDTLCSLYDVHKDLLSSRVDSRRISRLARASTVYKGTFNKRSDVGDDEKTINNLLFASSVFIGQISVLLPSQVAHAALNAQPDPLYDVSEFFELGIQLSYLLSLLALIGVGTFFVIRQVLMRRELDLSAKELQEQVRSGDATATEYFELGAVMLRRKIYPAATKYFLQAIEKWDGDNQDLCQVYNALGVSYIRDEKLDKAITQFEAAVKLQPGYVTAWNNLGDAYDKKKDYKSALKAFEEALLFDPNNTVARPRRDALRDHVEMYKGVPVKSVKKK